MEFLLYLSVQDVKDICKWSLRFFSTISPKCVFSLEGNIKNNIVLSETKLREGSQAMQIPL